MATDRAVPPAVPAAAAVLLWPAAWNGYPIVFSDTGTYLSQAVQHYAGWSRPVFYSLFMLPLHATVTTWPVVIVQALLAAWVLWLTWRALAPGAGAGWFCLVVAVLAAGTWLPWTVSELMPDLFTPLLILVLCLLCWAPRALSRVERYGLVGLATLFIASQQSSVALALGLIGAWAVVSAWQAGSGGFARLVPRRIALARPWNRGVQAEARDRAASPTRDDAAACTEADGRETDAAPAALLDRAGLRTGDRWLPIVPLALAVPLLCSMNLLAHGRFALSPFGNVFLVARVIYDGPGMATLRRDCPTKPWRLCPFLDRFPPTSDGFLWDADGPLNLAGGAKQVSAEAGDIIARSIRAEPGAEAAAAIGNALRQLAWFNSGDGLQAWPDGVTPWLKRDFPRAEEARYAHALQQNGQLAVPTGLGMLHKVVAVVGVLGCLVLLPLVGGSGRSGFDLFRQKPALGRLRPADAIGQPEQRRRRLGGASADRSAVALRAAQMGLLLTVLASLPLSAAITGMLSAPHDRYQARIMWLPPFAALVVLAGRIRQPRR